MFKIPSQRIRSFVISKSRFAVYIAPKSSAFKFFHAERVISGQPFIHAALKSGGLKKRSKSNKIE